jgi:hypothetical protein
VERTKTASFVQCDQTKMFSMVIPTYTVNDDLERMTLRAIRSYRYFIDELIISEDGGRYSPQMMALADIYLYGHGNVGFTANVNRGWNLSHGDFTAIVNSDTYLYEGDLKKLCIPGKITSPEIMNQTIPRLAGNFWVTPKELKEKYGILNEAMKNYCSDSDYDNRVAQDFQKVSEVKIFHAVSQTVRPTGAIEHSRDDEEIYRRLKEAKLAT